MAGRELDKTGRSPAEIRRLEARRKRMLAAAERRGGFNTRRDDAATTALAAKGSRANARKVDKPDAVTASPKKAKFGVGSSKTIMHNGKSMANVTGDQLKKTGLGLPAYMRRWKELGKRPTTATAADANRTAAQNVIAQGRRNNERAQLLAEAKTTTNTPPRPVFLPGLLPSIRPMFEDTGAGTTADKPAASNSGTSASRADTTSRSFGRRGSRTIAPDNDRRVGLKKGGVVKAPKKASKKSIDGIASKGKTRAKHR